MNYYNLTSKQTLQLETIIATAMVNPDRDECTTDADIRFFETEDFVKSIWKSIFNIKAGR